MWRHLKFSKLELFSLIFLVPNSAKLAISAKPENSRAGTTRCTRLSILWLRSNGYCMNLALGPLCAACAAPAPSGWRRWYIVVYSRCMPYSLQGLLIQLEASIIIANKQQSVIIQWLYILSCLEARLHKQVYIIHRLSLKCHISSYNFRPCIISSHE